jgi:hypothetical protein
MYECFFGQSHAFLRGMFFKSPILFLTTIFLKWAAVRKMVFFGLFWGSVSSKRVLLSNVFMSFIVLDYFTSMM